MVCVSGVWISEWEAVLGAITSKVEKRYLSAHHLPFK